MFYQTIQNTDTLKAATQQTAEVAKETAHTFGNVTFDISQIGMQGIIISVVGYVIVFFALLALFFFISRLTKVLNLNLRKRLREKGDVSADKEDLSLSGEVSTAIAMALHLHFAEVHDFESTVLTINKVQKTYSPWSSKIYGLRQYPNKITKSVEWK